MGNRKRPRLDPWLFGPPGVCDACGGPCGTMDQAGIVCYFCFAGVFMQRSFWQFARCPSCKGTDIFCVDCCGRAYVSTPREDIDVDELRQYWASVVARHSEFGEDLPAPIAVLKR
ncbi:MULTISPECIES: hypothetical protein [Xanthomonas]|uniref:Uncharacterized protein n=3 Tax=Xanthomonas TaxID=338 RepID=A0A6V7FH75_9XANT|nr:MULTISPECIES: hypothetical protein [Xanthomonas]CAD0362710.1 hypothetical protein CFBP8129_46100 [Xanthomonas hortorum pv. gardneri]CAD0362712.1 hypothetical protein CFBP8129_46100 [Xanthomonas hortorum pv. gardneri]